MRGSVIKRVLPLLLGVQAVVGASAWAGSGEIYIYKQHDGARLFTDQKKNRKSGYVYLGKYGRPTAYSSCGRLSEAALNLRANELQPLIGKHAAANGIPAELIRAVMHVESCFDRRAVSRVGAQGLMQLMPGTADMLGVRDSFDADQNIAGGARYLSLMRQRYPGDWRLVLAAYNAGPDAVDKYRNVPPYPETQSYVKRVMSIYQKHAAAPAVPAKPASTSASRTTVHAGGTTQAALD